MKRLFVVLALVSVVWPVSLNARPLFASGAQESRQSGRIPQQPAASVWRCLDRTQGTKHHSGGDFAPTLSSRFVLDAMQFRSKLAGAPLENLAVSSGIVIDLPMPDGSIAPFIVEESPILEPALALQYPETRTYAARKASESATTARLSWTATGGFHALILSPDGVVTIRPEPGQTGVYVSRASMGAGNDGAVLRCLPRGRGAVDPEPGENRADKAAGGPVSTPRGNELLTYRIAISACGEFTAIYGDRDAAMDAIVGVLTEVNLIFERELTIRLMLVAENQRIVFSNPDTDPYLPDLDWLSLNQAVTDLLIGTSSYDVGILLGTSEGGSSDVGTVCGPIRAQSFAGTADRWDNGDFLRAFMCHELGHAFGAGHSFNSTVGQCNQRDDDSAYEPGAGHTIMSYWSAWCYSDTAGTQFMPYFHAISYDQIVRFTTTGAGAACARRTPTGNSIPNIDAGADHTVPRETPFVLTAATSDADGDVLTTSWEQFDRGMTPTTAPILRSRTPVRGPSRTFPDMTTLFSERPDRNERLSVVDRDLHFRSTVRDNSTRGGGVNSDSMTVHVEGAPFRVTAPSEWGILWRAGERQTVRWDVGSSTAPTVRILLTTGRYVWTTLAMNVPNTGSFTITVPETPSVLCRIQVQAEGTIYFDVSDHDFAISACGPQGAPIAAGTYPGTLSTTDCRHPSYPSRYIDRFAFQTVAGAMYSVRLHSYDVDPMVGIVDATGTRLFVATADGPGGDAFIDFVAARSGRHVIEVSTARDAQVGAYAVTMGGLRNLLLDGGFEREDPVWVEHPEYSILNDDPFIPAFDDIRKATFDAIVNEPVSLSQILELPEDGVDRIATFWIRFESPGKKSTAASMLSVSVRSPYGKVVPLWSETAYDAKWYPKEYRLVVVNIPAELAISGASLVFEATEKSVSATRFHVDEIALQ